MLNDKIKLTNAFIETYVLDNFKELSVKKRPGVLICPGGGFAFCSNREGEPVALAFNNAGFNAFVLKYTVKNGADKAIDDGIEALKYLNDNKEKYGLNSIVICGFSAGAHVAAAVSVFTKEKPSGMILVYPPVSELRGSYDILANIDCNTPKAFVVHSYCDKTVSVEQSLKLMNKLYEKGVDFESHIYHSGEHGFSLATKPISAGKENVYNLPNKNWIDMAIRWISDCIADIEFQEKIQKEDIPNNLMQPLINYLSNERIINAINEFYPKLIEENNNEQFSSFPLGMIIIYTRDTNLDQIKLLSNKIYQIEKEL